MKHAASGRHSSRTNCSRCANANGNMKSARALSRFALDVLLVVCWFVAVLLDKN